MTHPLVRLVSENGVVTVGQEPACQEQKDVIWVRALGSLLSYISIDI
jgi:hypothetical protein